MEHTTNRTFICSVVFLDIVDYSQLPVDEQIQIKNRFNGILAEAIKDVAVNDRIILDTGDGAAISFLGDPEDALFVALNIRDAITSDSISSKHRFSACTGINLGPVKLVQDLNGQRNLIGDGINVAQRVMSFAKPGQILVSRSYYEVISRISQEYAKLFHYEGARADKHVREHQVYSVYPPKQDNDSPAAAQAPVRGEARDATGSGGDRSAPFTETVAQGRSGGDAMPREDGPSSRPPFLQEALKRISGDWNARFSMWGKRWGKGLHADTLRNRRTMSLAAAALIALLIIIPMILWKTGGMRNAPPEAIPLAPSAETSQPSTEGTAGSEKGKQVDNREASAKAETSVSIAKREALTVDAAPKTAAPAVVSLGIAPWGEIYLDGQKKGISPPLNRLQMDPGLHTIEIRNSTFTPFIRTVDLKPGEQLKVTCKFK